MFSKENFSSNSFLSKRILTEIWIYPIKSLGGVRKSSAQVMQKGLQYDRRWMLVDEQNIFLTQRTIPQLALFKLEESESGFTIRYQHDTIFLPAKEELHSNPMSAQIWDDAVTVHEVSRAHSVWFSARLGFTCRLVAFPELQPRSVDPDFAIRDEQVSLADGYPLLIIGEPSLHDLNQRLSIPVPMDRFRPNLVFSGGEAYEEDQWKNFSVGVNRFTGVKPCSRCVLTTVNQQSGEKGTEPLATLAGYRKKNGKVYFGQNVLAIDHKEIYEGDEITIE